MNILKTCKSLLTPRIKNNVFVSETELQHYYCKIVSFRELCFSRNVSRRKLKRMSLQHSMNICQYIPENFPKFAKKRSNSNQLLDMYVPS